MGSKRGKEQPKDHPSLPVVSRKPRQPGSGRSTPRRSLSPPLRELTRQDTPSVSLEARMPRIQLTRSPSSTSIKMPSLEQICASTSSSGSEESPRSYSSRCQPRQKPRQFNGQWPTQRRMSSPQPYHQQESRPWRRIRQAPVPRTRASAGFTTQQQPTADSVFNTVLRLSFRSLLTLRLFMEVNY